MSKKTEERPKITNGDLFNLLRSLNMCSNLKGSKFVYAIAKNMAILKRETGIIEKAIEPSKEFLEQDKKRDDLCKELCDKDKDGKPMFEPGERGGYLITKNKEEFEKRMELLKQDKEYAKTYEERKKQFEDYAKLLDDPSNVDLFKIKKEFLPEDITSGQLAGIWEIIED